MYHSLLDTREALSSFLVKFLEQSLRNKVDTYDTLLLQSSAVFKVYVR
jgi:hypothetical protein